MYQTEDVDTKYEVSGETPLWTAASNGREAIVKLLLEKEGVDINYKNQNDETPLWAAVSYGNEAVVKLFLEKEGVDIYSKTITATHH
ncbi:hypothetical protein RUND412_001829 [Rhizina undulata]